MSETILGVVYIVDADESVRQGLTRLVESAGLEAKPCDSIEAFLRQTPATHVACALLGISSRHVRAPAIWSRLCAIAGELPVIALSARDDPETRRTARELGAQAFFRKPVDAAALLDSIDWVMQAGARGKGD